MTKQEFDLEGEVWLYPGESASWHFVTLPKKESEMIKASWGKASPGWGSLSVRATIGQTSWQTSIFPDKHSGGYLLPLKATVREKEYIRVGDRVAFRVVLRPKRSAILEA